MSAVPPKFGDAMLSKTGKSGMYLPLAHSVFD